MTIKAAKYNPHNNTTTVVDQTSALYRTTMELKTGRLGRLTATLKIGLAPTFHSIYTIKWNADNADALVEAIKADDGRINAEAVIDLARRAVASLATH